MPYDDDEDDRPRKRRRRDEDDYDDEEDDRPRPRRKKRKPAGPPVGLIVGGAVAGVLLLAGLGVFVYTQVGGPPRGGPAFAPGAGKTAGDQVRTAAGEPTMGPGISVAARPYVTLSGFRKVTAGGKTELQVNYTLDDPEGRGATHVLVVREGRQHGASRFSVTGERIGLVRVTGQLPGAYAGPVDAWVERREFQGGGRTAVVVSNVVSVP